jgi:hypothetical protein
MDSDLVKALELVLLFGAVLAFGGYELWSLRRDRKRSARDDRGTARADSSPSQHPDS